jgi:signal transduction histidine kinase
VTSAGNPHSPRGVLISVLRSPCTGRTWIDTAFVAVGLPLAVLTSTTVLTLFAMVLCLLPTTVLVLPVLAALYWCGRLFTTWQLARLRLFLGIVIPAAPQPHRAGTRLRRLWAQTRVAGTWRRLGYHALSVIVETAGFSLVFGIWIAGVGLGTIGLWVWAEPPGGGLLGYSVHSAARLVFLTLAGLAALFAAPWVARLVVRLQVSLAAGMLSIGRKEKLTRQVASLARSRTEVIDAADTERRRIERDLHDGAQQRLVSLALNLGMTRTMLTDVPEPVRAAVEQAHDEAKQALSELRDFVRGLHPAVLDDLGLDAALSGIAARCAVPVRLLVQLPRRPPGAVETVAYFVVSEALANVAKHARATQVDVVVEQLSAVLRIIVSDNGRGGADESLGSGLRGLGQRVRSLDGSMIVNSPPGGPTLLVVELPCAS